jgi:hypothetical protein
MTKTCIYCKQTKDSTDFPKHSHYKDNLDSRCRACVKEHSDIRKALHKKAPPKPTACECCGEVPLKWCLDHDHDTNEIRGWLCDQCNTGIGKLGDNLTGIKNALVYLERVQKIQKNLLGV